ncbi:MAG: hypothetical protein DCF31_16085 [Alphaproteobacteria bacterium]|nr:MAG: hypothetical protein DCF31_16085 [Alphaproteobacteria bacterium]
MDEDSAPPEDDDNARRHWISLEYDYLKQLTSLSLLAIGGTLTVAGSIFAQVPDKTRMWQALAAFVVGGILAFSAQSEMLSSLRKRRPLGKRIFMLGNLAAAAFGLGSAGLIIFAYQAIGQPDLLIVPAGIGGLIPKP